MTVRKVLQRIARGGLPVVLFTSMLVVIEGAGPITTPSAALAANPSPGTPLGSVHLSVPCSSGIGVGVAFDGTNLWYSCYSQSPDLFRASPTTGKVSASYTIAGGLGALAYDAADNVIYAGYGGSNTGEVYSIQLDSRKNVVSSKTIFNTCSFSCLTTIDDGLAFDAGTHTLYFSPDTSTTVWHLSTSGTVLGSFPWVGAGCYNSGLAIGGELLFEGADGCKTVYVVDKATPTILDFSFATGGTRDEGLACDDSTFGQDAIWSKDAYTPVAYAFAIPAGSCGVGGKPVGTRTVEFVHGINGNYRQFECGNLSGSFRAILARLCAEPSQFTVDSFPYYQDQGYASSSGQPCPSMPAPNTNTGILYVDPDSIDPTICDSKGALAYSAAALDAHLAALSGSVSVVAHSMGGAITRGWLALAGTKGSSDPSLSNVDSVLFLQGAQAGSWAAGAGEALNGIPIVDRIVQEVTRLAHLDVNRPGVMDVAPLSAWYQSVNPALPYPGVPTQLAYYNFYGALSLQLQVNFGLFTLNEGSFNAGDLVMLPGSDNPADLPLSGGARFLPGGVQTTNRHQFVVSDQVNLNPLDFVVPSLLARDVQQVLASPVTHFNFSTHTNQVMVTGCGPRSPQVSVTSEVLRILQDPTQGCS
jgi:pimeloyl-ACP methyl ester carboxylesterase